MLAGNFLFAAGGDIINILNTVSLNLRLTVVIVRYALEALHFSSLVVVN